MKIKYSKPDSAKNAIAHQPLWMAIPQESQETISGGMGYKHILLLQERYTTFAAGKLFKEMVANK